MPTAGWPVRTSGLQITRDALKMFDSEKWPYLNVGMLVSLQILHLLRNISLETVHLFYLKTERFMREELLKSFTFKLLLFNIEWHSSREVQKNYFILKGLFVAALQTTAELIHSFYFDVFTEGLSSLSGPAPPSVRIHLTLAWEIVLRFFLAVVLRGVVVFEGIFHWLCVNKHPVLSLWP